MKYFLSDQKAATALKGYDDCVSHLEVTCFWALSIV
jgi:hypothetical protein